MESKPNRQLPQWTIDTTSSNAIRVKEGKKISPESIEEYYKDNVFNTPETSNKLTFITPLLQVFDTFDGTVTQKRITLSYLLWTADGKIDTNAATLGIPAREYEQNTELMMNENNPDQKAASKIFETISNLPDIRKTILIKELMRKGWTNKSIIKLLDSNNQLITKMRKEVNSEKANQTSTQ